MEAPENKYGIKGGQGHSSGELLDCAMIGWICLCVASITLILLTI